MPVSRLFSNLRAAPRFHRADSVRRTRGNAGETEARKSFHNRRVSLSLPSIAEVKDRQRRSYAEGAIPATTTPPPLAAVVGGFWSNTVPHTPTHLIFLASGDKAATMASQWPTPISATIGDGRNAHFTVLPSGPSSSNRTYPNPNSLECRNRATSCPSLVHDEGWNLSGVSRHSLVLHTYLYEYGVRFGTPSPPASQGCRGVAPKLPSTTGQEMIGPGPQISDPSNFSGRGGGRG